MQRANQRIAFFNGQYVPESEVKVPFRDRSFLYGDGCFDMTRTFNGRPFRVKEHIERFYRSLAYLRIDIGMTQDEMIEVTHEVVRRNAHLPAPHTPRGGRAALTRPPDRPQPVLEISG